jgi:Tc5 transposase DNA-binding domain/helix-turn-helix, Psq domain
MPSYTENALQDAYNAVLRGVDIARAVRDYGVPRTTLVSRLRGTQPKIRAQAYRQRLSTTQEAHLVDWILAQIALGVPPSHAQIRALATRVLEVAGDTTPLGRHWLEAFFKCNPGIKTRPSRRIESSRLNGATTEVI